MKPTNLEWEDVIQFEEVKGYGQHIWRDGNNLYYVTEEGGIAPQRVVYDYQMSYLPYWKVGRELYAKYLGRFRTIVGHQRKKREENLEENL